MNIKFFVLFFFGCLFITFSKEQTKKDTTILVQQIAALYLNTMYADKNFDSAYKMWNNEMFENLQSNGNPKSRGVIKDTNNFIRKMKLQMIKYYKRSDSFKIIEFTSKYIIPQAPNMYMLNYLYSTDFDHSYQQNNSSITVYFNKKNSSWSISDARLVGIYMRLVAHYYDWKKLL